MKSRAFVSAAVLVASLGATSVARGEEMIIKNPGDHPVYRVELEPHALVGFGGPFHRGRGELGAGFRATFVIVENGFVKSINNNVGVGVGGDAFFGRGTIFVPVVMQWNFFLSEHWAVFGEPGIGFAANGASILHPTLAVGGKYFFNDKISLTMRLGYPAFAIGASFHL